MKLVYLFVVLFKIEICFIVGYDVIRRSVKTSSCKLIANNSERAFYSRDQQTYKLLNKREKCSIPSVCSDHQNGLRSLIWDTNAAAMTSCENVLDVDGIRKVLISKENSEKMTKSSLTACHYTVVFSRATVTLQLLFIWKLQKLREGCSLPSVDQKVNSSVLSRASLVNKRMNV